MASEGMNALGAIETFGLVWVLEAGDAMCKAGDVSLVSWERRLGGRLVTIIVEGDVAAVTEAVEAAAHKAVKKPVNYAVIASPHEEIVRLVNISRSRWDKDFRNQFTK